VNNKFFSRLLLALSVATILLFLVIIPLVNSLKYTIGAFIYNKYMSESANLYMYSEDESRYLPNASGVLTTSYYKLDGNDGGKVICTEIDGYNCSLDIAERFQEVPQGDAASIFTPDYSSPDFDNNFYIDFRAFLDNLFYGDFAWENWVRDKYYVHSYILESNQDYLAIYIMYPDGEVFSGFEKKVKVECTRENSILVSGENFELLRTNIDVLSELKRGYGFFSYCLDKECNTLGKSCVLVKL